VIALSAPEAAAVRHFVSGGGVVIADGEPGQFDGHSRRLPSPLLADLFASASGRGKAIRLAVKDTDHRAVAAESVLMQELAAIFAESGIGPAYRLTEQVGKPVTDVETYQFDVGGATVLALLGDAPPTGKTEPGGARELLLHLPQQAYIYDLRTHESLGYADHLGLRLDPLQPRILAISDQPLPAPTIALPSRARCGETAVLKLGFTGVPVAKTGIVRIEVSDPAGQIVPYYSRKLVVRGAVAQLALPLASNDPAGDWAIRVTDVLSGQTATAVLRVVER
jgi:hypothetical protein